MVEITQPATLVDLEPHTPRQNYSVAFTRIDASVRMSDERHAQHHPDDGSNGDRNQRRNHAVAQCNHNWNERRDGRSDTTQEPPFCQRAQRRHELLPRAVLIHQWYSSAIGYGRITDHSARPTTVRQLGRVVEPEPCGHALARQLTLHRLEQ